MNLIVKLKNVSGLPVLPPGAKFEALEGVGHFMHIEQPDLIANKILKFIEETSRD